MHLTKQILLLLFISFFYLNATAQSKPDFTKKNYRSEDFNDIDSDKREINLIDSLYEIRDYYTNGKLAISAFTKEKPKFLFYKKQGKYLRYNKEGILTEEAWFKDDLFTGLRTQFFPDGKIYKKTHYENETQKVLEVWSADGQQLVKDGNGKSKEYSRDLEAIEEGLYKAGLRDGTWTGCYESGQLCYTETYNDGKLIKGTSHDTDGKDYTYTEVYQLPEFKGGIPAIYEFIIANLKYPAKAQRFNKQGTVHIKFAVEKDGSVIEAYPLKLIEPSLDEEAMRVVKLSTGRWLSGKNRALPARTYFIMPINFRLE